MHQGIEFDSDSDPALTLDMYCDADFAGLWQSEDNQDAVCVKSRTGYVLTLGGFPPLSNLENEYISLAQGMRDLIPMRRLLKEVLTSLGAIGDGAAIVKSTVFEDNNGALGLATRSFTLRTYVIAAVCM
jgi:hypothetical protein